MCVRLRVEEERGREKGGKEQSEETEREGVGLTQAAPDGSARSAPRSPAVVTCLFATPPSAPCSEGTADT